MFANEQGINKIVFTRAIRPFCPLGNDTYQAVVTVEFYPNEYLFDFCEVDKKIQELSKEELIAEDVAEKVYEMMQNYLPKAVTVKVDAESNTHFPVTIII